jgi:hypothetical protein
MMAAPLVKTKTPGVYKRGNRYVVRYRFRGEERKRFAATYAEARDLKSTLQADIRRGEHRETARMTFEEYGQRARRPADARPRDDRPRLPCPA